MSEQQSVTPSELRALKHGYRSLQSPAFMATRIRAGLNAQQVRRARRRPVLAVVAIAIGVLAILPFIPRQETAPLPLSMAALPMGLTSVRLPPSPSLTKLRSVSTPALPPRPVRPSSDKSGKQPDVQTRYPWQKEKTHEIT